MIVFDLNRWLLSNTTVAGLLDYTLGDPTPILPVQNQPEIEGTHMVYDFESRVDPEEWWLETTVVTYEIWSFSYDKAVELERAVSRMTRHDRAWRALTDFVDDADYTVQDIRHVFSGDLPPPEQEGGKFGRLVVLELVHTDTGTTWP